MQGYTERVIFTRQEIRVWKMATEMVNRLPDPLESNEIRCHELARAVGQVLGLDHSDGKFGFVEHSWLRTCPDVKGRSNILDVYAVGMVPMVMLVDTKHVTLQMRKLYVPAKIPRTDIDEDRVKWLIQQMAI